MKLQAKMHKSVVVIALLTLTALTASAQQSKRKTLTGVVTDAACGAAHNMKNMSPAVCARACAKNMGTLPGYGYALVVGNEVYKLQGHEADLDKFAAEMVTVKGNVNGKTMKVDSIIPVKKPFIKTR